MKAEDAKHPFSPTAEMTFFSYTKEYLSLGNTVKSVLQEHSIPFQEEFDHVIGAYLIRVRGSDFADATKQLNRELGDLEHHSNSERHAKSTESLTPEECRGIGGRLTERGCVAEDVNFEKLAELRGYDIPSMEAVVKELAGNLPQTTGTTYGSGRLWANWHSWKREASE